MTLAFDAALDAFAARAPVLPLAVALSGGADSTALLLGCARRWPQQVVAVHVHHGLQAAADGFEAHCRALCQRLAVPLAVCHVDARPQPGQSPEDAARQARYAAITAALDGAFDDAPDRAPDGGTSGALGCTWQGLPKTGLRQSNTGKFAIKSIALAHHADDQAETLLLALLRGAGLPGLAAMPAQWLRGGLVWHRPLLAVPGQAVREWLRAQGQPWVHDPSNDDTRYTRNRLRSQVLPVLAEAFPAFRDTLARSAAHAAQAQALLDELAAADLAALWQAGGVQGQGAQGEGVQGEGVQARGVSALGRRARKPQTGEAQESAGQADAGQADAAPGGVVAGAIDGSAKGAAQAPAAQAKPIGAPHRLRHARPQAPDVWPSRPSPLPLGPAPLPQTPSLPQIPPQPTQMSHVSQMPHPPPLSQTPQTPPLFSPDALTPAPLPIRGLQALSPARQANVLRHWLKATHATTPSAAQLAELQAQLAACTTRGHRLHIKVGRGFVQRVGSGIAWSDG